MTELKWSELAVKAYQHLSSHGRAVLSAHVGGSAWRKSSGYWFQMSAMARKKEMRRRGLIP